MDRIKMAEELEAQAAKLRKEADRNLPDVWEVGQKVRYIRDSEWAWSAGETAEVIEIRNEYKGKPAAEYQVFYTGRPGGHGRYWTTPDDVELLPSPPSHT